MIACFNTASSVETYTHVILAAGLFGIGLVFLFAMLLIAWGHRS